MRRNANPPMETILPLNSYFFNLFKGYTRYHENFTEHQIVFSQLLWD